jgi:hypothetical protein
MSSVKITELTNVLGSQINPSVDVLPIVRVGANSTDKITVEELGTLFGGGLEGSQYIYVAANGTDVENAAELQAAYTAAQMRLPTSTKRITIIAGPGNYNFESNVFTMDTNFIDLVSLDGNRSIVFNAPLVLSTPEKGSIFITANDVFVKGVDVQTKQFKTNPSLNLLKIENCTGGNNSFGVFNAAGTYINCVGGDFSFGGNGGSSGTFINCKAGAYSFGGGTTFPTSSGIYENCKAGAYSFGGSLMGGVSSGTYTNCTGASVSFGGNGTANGIFNNCIGESTSFGGFGTLDGFLYYCRLTSGTFETVTGAGKTVYCVDGNGEPNNQGFTPQNKL